MELMQLEMFVAVFEERSVQRAAERVRRTQPVVSLALGKLESNIGSRLMERRRGDYQLTDAGKVLYEYASRIIALRNEALSQFSVTSTARTGRLCVGVAISEPALWLSQLSAAFGKKFPGVRLDMSHDRPEVLATDLAERRIDLAFFPAPPERAGASDTFSWLPLWVPGGSGGQVHPVWLVQHRIGCSYMAKAFEDVAVLLSRDCPAASRAHINPTDVRLRSRVRGPHKSALNATAISRGALCKPVNSGSL